MLTLLFPLSCIYFQPIVFLHCFYGFPTLRLYGAIEKYTKSRLIISQLVERSHFFCVVFAAVAKKKPPPTPLEHSHLFGRHTWVKLSISEAHHTSDFSSGSAGFELWRRPRGLCERQVRSLGSAAGSLPSSSYSFNRDAFPIDRNSRNLWSINISLCLLDCEIDWLKRVQVCFRSFYTRSGGALVHIPCMLTTHL